MRFVSDLERIASQEMEEFRKDVCRSPRYIRWRDRRRSQQPTPVQPRKYLPRRREEDGETQ
jgi:hypothetical protein